VIDGDEALDGGGDEETVTTLVVPEAALGTRLDAFLASAMPGSSRSRLQQLIEAARVTLDGKPGRSAQKLNGGEQVVVIEPAPVPTELLPEDIPLAILFEDDDVLVIDKPAGLVMHPGAGNPTGTLANAILFHAPGVSIGGESRPGIVHRLDKDTSGVLVAAKNELAHRGLAAAFAARTVDKRYTAFCLGRPRQDRFELTTGHKRADNDRRRFTTKVPPEGSRLARSRFTVVVASSGVAELDVELFTGRTHQIRAHLADVGHALLQDELYGGGRAEKRIGPGAVRDVVARLARQALHARVLTFPHPRTGERLTFEAPLPDDLRALHEALEAAP
jgi:23S rRNA pseudouridine1911/1915/1917 synthase